MGEVVRRQSKAVQMAQKVLMAYDKDDLINLQVTRHHEAYLARQKQLTAKLETARAAVEKADKTLTEYGRKLVDDESLEHDKSAAKSLVGAGYGRGFKVKVDFEGRDDQAQKFKFEVEIGRESEETGRFDSLISRKGTLAYDRGAKQWLFELMEAREVVSGLEKDLFEVRKGLSEKQRLRDLISAELTRRALDQEDGGDELLKAIESVTIDPTLQLPVLAA